MASKRAVKRKLQRSTCGDKRRYDTQAEAVAHKTSAERNQINIRPDKVLSTYHCPFCGKWHVGRKVDDRRSYNID